MVSLVLSIFLHAVSGRQVSVNKLRRQIVHTVCDLSAEFYQFSHQKVLQRHRGPRRSVQSSMTNCWDFGYHKTQTWHYNETKKDTPSTSSAQTLRLLTIDIWQYKHSYCHMCPWRLFHSCLWQTKTSNCTENNVTSNLEQNSGLEESTISPVRLHCLIHCRRNVRVMDTKAARCGPTIADPLRATTLGRGGPRLRFLRWPSAGSPHWPSKGCHIGKMRGQWFWLTGTRQ